MSTPVTGLPAPKFAGTEVLAAEKDAAAVRVAASELQAGRTYDFSIYEEGGTFYALSGNGATYSDSSLKSVFETVTQLDSGRTHSVSVSIAGDVAIGSSSVLVPSYTNVYILGRVNAPSDVDAVFENKDRTTTGNVNIGFFGPGTIDARRIGGVSVQNNNPILVNQCEGLVIDGLRLLNSKTHLMNLKDCPGARITNNYLNTYGDDGISYLGPYSGTAETGGCVISNNEITGGLSDEGGGTGIEVEDGGGTVVISNNWIHDCTGGGIKVVNDPGGLAADNSHISITGNLVTDMTLGAVSLLSNKVGHYVYNAAITGNVAARCGNGAIELTRARFVAVSGNSSHDCDRGLFIGEGSQHITVTSLTCSSPKTLGIMAYQILGSGIDDTDIRHLKFSGISVENPNGNALQCTGVTNVMITQLTAWETRTSPDWGLQYVVRLSDCDGHLAVTFTQGFHNDFGGSNVISKSGSTGTVIGDTGDDFAVTNTTVSR
jgi:hypothetical protein